MWFGIYGMIATWFTVHMYSDILLGISIFFFVFSIYMFLTMLVGQRKVDEFEKLPTSHKTTYLCLLFCNCAKITRSQKFNSHSGMMKQWTNHTYTKTEEQYEFRAFEKEMTKKLYEKALDAPGSDIAKANLDRKSKSAYKQREKEIKDAEARQKNPS
jgi:hypothetical protein